MSIEKIREEFDAWASTHMVWADDGERLPMDYLTGCYYEHVQTQAAWEAWQASRQEAKQILASSLISQLSLTRGRPVEWCEAVVITALITGMSDEEKQRLLDLDGF